jgi:hypothetical protein
MMMQEKPMIEDVFNPKQDSIPEERIPRVEDLLREVFAILKERGKVYDTSGESGCERSMEKTVALFNLRTGHNLTEAQGWIFMGYLKDVRQDAAGGKHRDSAVDKVSYALLEAEARFRARMNTE